MTAECADTISVVRLSSLLAVTVHMTNRNAIQYDLCLKVQLFVCFSSVHFQQLTPYVFKCDRCDESSLQGYLTFSHLKLQDIYYRILLSYIISYGSQK